MHLARRILGRALPDPGYHGWVVAGMCMLCAALSGPGQSFLLSFYLEPLMHAVGISRIEISTIYSLATLAAALTLPLAGARADRAHSGRFLGTIVLLMAAALILLSFTTNIWLLAAAFFALRMLGQGAIGIGTLTVAVRWFDRHRGRAFALIALGYAFGEMAFPATVLALIGRVGWRGSLLVLAGAYALAFAPLVRLAVRDPRPEEAARQRPLSAESDRIESRALPQALRTPVFYGMTLVYGILLQPRADSGGRGGVRGGHIRHVPQSAAETFESRVSMT